MRLTSVVAAILFLSVACNGQEYIAIMPNEMRNGMDYEVDVTLLTPPTGDVTVLVNVTNNGQLAWNNSNFEIDFRAGETFGSGKLMVPYDIYTGSQFDIYVQFVGVAFKTSSVRVTLVRPSPSLFVQTDKGMYKPGDLVQYRVLSTTEKLIPKQEKLTVHIFDAAENMIDDKVVDPSDPNFQALMSGEIQLSDDPLLGTYKIKASTETGYVEVNFEVAPYVLPKFEVKLELDRSYAVKGPDASISGEVISKYTYGQMVKGELTISIGGKVVLTETNFDGMKTFDLPVAELPVETFYFDYYMPSRSQNVFAEVSEMYTNNKANDTKSFTMHEKEFKATIVTPLPFHFQGTTSYTFQSELTNVGGGALTDWDEDATQDATDLSYYTLTYTYNGNPTTVDVTSNPMSITLDVTDTDSFTCDLLYTYEYKDGSKIDGTAAKLDPPKYYTASSGELTIVEIPANNQNERCFQMESFTTGDKAFYQVVNNYYEERLMAYTNTNGHCFTVNNDHAPVSLVVAYKIAPYLDEKRNAMNELLTAFVAIEMPWTSAQEVTMEITPGTVKPGESVTINIAAVGSGKSVVGYSGVDKSTTLLADANDITAAKLQEAVEGYRLFSREKPNPFPNPPIFPFFRGGPMLIEQPKLKRKKRCIACWDQNTYMDSTKVLKEAGLTVLTDMTLYQHHGYRTDYEYPEMAFDAAPNEGGRKQEKGNNVDAGDDTDAEVELEGGDEVETRTDFPETWLWGIQETDNNGNLQLVEEVPDTITSFVVNAFAFNSIKGLGVAPSREVIIFQDMFLSMNLPYSVVRYEDFALQILVFNYLSTVAEVTVELLDGDDFSIMDSSQKSQVLEIGGSASGVMTVWIKATTVGDIKLSATLKYTTSGVAIDAVERELLVKPEGIEVVRSTNLKLPMTDAGTKPFDLTALFDPTQMENYVEDSLRMYLKVTGDMMGPFIDNLEGKIRMPSGCGEQNIQSLTPSMFVAKYLKSLNRYDDAIEAKVGKVCGYGYRKELVYKHSDGSYSAFGESANLCSCGASGDKKGSTWLTAYVLKSFSLLKQQQLTFVDPAILKSAFTYLNSTIAINCNDQYFVELGELIHKEMAGGTSSTGEARIGFTAFCTIAVIDYKGTLEGTDTTHMVVDSVLTKASEWLLSKKDALIAKQNPFQLAVTAFTLAKISTSATDSRGQAAMQLVEALEGLADQDEITISSSGECLVDLADIKKEGTSCSNDANCGDGYECCRVTCTSRRACKQKKNNHYSWHRSGPSEVETLGYHLMTYLALSELNGMTANQKQRYRDLATQLQDELLKLRGDSGFFASTQDTAVALEALSMYAILFDNSGADFMIKAQADGAMVTDSIIIGDNNFTIYGSEKLNVNGVPTTVNAVAEGTKGVAYASLLAIYNLKTNVTKTPLNITVQPRTYNGEKVIYQCVHSNPSVGQVGTMVVTSLIFQSGYKFESLDAGKVESLAPTKKEYDEQTGKLSIYYMNPGDFDKERCVKIYFSQEYKVKNRAAAEAIAYDYYEPMQNAQTMYNVDQDSLGCVGDCETTGASGNHVNIFLMAFTCLALLVNRWIH